MAEINIYQSHEWKRFHDQNLEISVFVKDEDDDEYNTGIDKFYVSLKADEMNFACMVLDEMQDKLCSSVGWRFEHEYKYMVQIELSWEANDWTYKKRINLESFYQSNDKILSEDWEWIYDPKHAIGKHISPIVQAAIDKIEKYQKQPKKQLTYPCNW